MSDAFYGPCPCCNGTGRAEVEPLQYLANLVKEAIPRNEAYSEIVDLESQARTVERQRVLLCLQLPHNAAKYRAERDQIIAGF